MSTAGNIKAQIVTLLTTLKPTYIAEIETTDVREDPLNGDIIGFPHVFVYPPSLETSDRVDNRTNFRDYVFTVTVFQNAANIASSSDTEDLMELIMNKIDDDQTLGGTAIGGVFPVTSRPEPFTHGDQTYVVFDVIIRARAIYCLT